MEIEAEPWIPGLSGFRGPSPFQPQVDIGNYGRCLSPPSSEHVWEARSLDKDYFAADRSVHRSVSIVEAFSDFSHPLTAGPAGLSDSVSEQAQCPLLRLASFSVDGLECAKCVSTFLYAVVWTELTIVAGSETLCSYPWMFGNNRENTVITLEPSGHFAADLDTGECKQQ